VKSFSISKKMNICPSYEYPPRWLPPQDRPYVADYSSDPEQFMPRIVKLSRIRVSDALGFNVRGGQEHLCGIYISKVMPNTEAERLGLREGDQILTVNDMDFENIEHGKAVKILKSTITIVMHIRFFPFGYSQTYEKSKPLPCMENQTC